MLNKILAVSKENKILFSLAWIYVVGIVGILSPFQSIFLPLSALNLLITAATLYYLSYEKKSGLLPFFVLTFCAGYGVEVAGVHTGVIFGDYHYGANLGVKLFEVPLIIGINWFILVYGTAHVSKWLGLHSTFNASLIGASLMTALDYLIEPVAIALDFWQWEKSEVPLQNYIAWWVIAFFLHIAYHVIVKEKTPKKPALLIFALQLVFFAVLNAGL